MGDIAAAPEQTASATTNPETIMQSAQEPPAGPPPLTSDKPDVFHHLPLPVILPAATLGAGVGTAVIAFHGPLLAALAAGVVVAAFGALRVHGRNVWRILAMRLALRWRERRQSGVTPSVEPFDVPVPESDGNIYGMRWDGRCLITMVRVEPRGVAPTLLSPTVIRTADEIPLDEVARCLSQFDIRLAAIDVVALGVRAGGNHEAVRIYEQILGSLPATATRTVWLTLRLDPMDNTEAIGNRGGGTEGAVRTAMVATRRVVNRLARHGVRVRVLTAAELTAAESATGHDIDPGQWLEDWHALRCNGIELAGYTIQPDRLNSDVMAGIWAVPGLSTMVRLQVRPAGGSAARRESGGRVAVTALVRHDTAGAATEEVRTRLSGLGLRPLTGVQRQMLLEGGDHGAASFGVPAALTWLTVPSGGCGQVIGATTDGFGVAVPLFGPAVRRVEIVGSLWLVQQTTLRAMAVGARVIVHSTRPQDWAHLAEQIGAPEALSVSHPGGGAQHTAAATMIVYDGVASAGQVSEATVVHVRAPGEDESAAILDADVVLVESADRRDDVRIRTAAGEFEVRIVSIPEELRYLSGANPGGVETLQPA
ncbi:type VII secretion protein EccE [Nocardia sp. NEAU-G5]|uniref:Type VII secretion protein EccE n=1 Tax=Nocardia albiluteola TaxID=2842303 RepID=A0ABS6B8A5_9NOCA|nr:type VII secretion protein EccE [Nocardia albiluteola]MBU3065399.1 type VII secretion protein EccE [Nocardia albiluteola]